MNILEVNTEGPELEFTQFPGFVCLLPDVFTYKCRRVDVGLESGYLHFSQVTEACSSSGPALNHVG